MGRAVKKITDIPKKPRFEFSKIIIIVAGIFNIAVIVYSMILMWHVGDASPLAYLIPSVSGEVGTAIGFYYNKAKIENRLKLMALYKVEPERQDFTDNGSSGNGYFDGGMSI